MLKFHRQVNEEEQCIGLYISSTNIDQQSMIIIQYFIDLIKTKKVKSPLLSPVILLFDPELKNNKLDIKVSTKYKFRERRHVLPSFNTLINLSFYPCFNFVYIDIHQI